MKAGTPRSPARDFVPCTPDLHVDNSVSCILHNHSKDFVPCTPDLRAVFQFYFTELFVFGPIFATFQQDRIEESCLCDTNTLSLPEFQHSKEGYDDYDTRMFVFKQIRKMDTGAST